MRPLALVAIIASAAAAGASFYLYQQRREAAQLPPGPQLPAALVETLPEFQLADRDGQMRSLAHWSGKSLVVNFWATWCAPCRREIPLLLQLQRDHAAEGLQVVGIAVDFRDKVLAYAEEMKIDYPLLIGEQEALDAAAAFGVESVGFPFTVFSDRQGRIVTAHLGELTAAEAAVILDAVRRVNDGLATPAEARVALEAALRDLPEAAAEGG